MSPPPQQVRPQGLPGTRTYVWFETPGEREPRQVGSVTAILARPEATPDPRLIRPTLETEGDSHIAVCTPAVPDVPRRFLTFESTWPAGTVSFRGDANSQGFLGKISISGLPFSDAYECETAGMNIIMPTLSLLSYENNVPVFVWHVHVAPAGTNLTHVRIAAPFAPKRHGNRQHTFPPSFAKVTAAYREALNLTQISPLLAFLLFYRVLEATQSLRTPPASDAPRVKQRVPPDWEEVRTWLAASLNLPIVPSLEETQFIVPAEALNQRYSRLRDDRLRPLRNRIAHGLIDENGERPAEALSSVDDPDLHVEVHRWMPICRILARLELADVGGLQEVPLGIPPKVALEQRAQHAATFTAGET
jgi:hypothetical protein